MAKAVADSDSPDNQGGFVYDYSNITGFSSLHDSGTGGNPSLGNFALFPHAQCPGDDLDRCVFPKKLRKLHYRSSTLASKPGFFSLQLVNNVTTEMTAAHFTSYFRFSFPGVPGNDTSPLILLDLTDLSDSRQDNGTILVSGNRILGGARYLPSFGIGTYDAYFCADFSGADIRDSGIFANSRASNAVQSLTISRSINGYPLPGGAFIRFKAAPKNTVLVKVGLSFINSEQACSNLDSDIPAGTSFETIRSAAENSWRAKLGAIRLSMNKVNSSLVTNFYRYGRIETKVFLQVD
jgi:putative alpha-1,2-mannosidase